MLNKGSTAMDRGTKRFWSRSAIIGRGEISLDGTSSVQRWWKHARISILLWWNIERDVCGLIVRNVNGKFYPVSRIFAAHSISWCKMLSKYDSVCHTLTAPHKNIFVNTFNTFLLDIQVHNMVMCHCLRLLMPPLPPSSTSHAPSVPPSFFSLSLSCELNRDSPGAVAV